jgi:hypothetical protein
MTVAWNFRVLKYDQLCTWTQWNTQNIPVTQNVGHIQNTSIYIWDFYKK